MKHLVQEKCLTPVKVLHPVTGARQDGSLLWIDTSVDVINKTEINLMFTLHVFCLDKKVTLQSVIQRKRFIS